MNRNILDSACRWLSGMRERHVTETVTVVTEVGNVSLLATPTRRNTLTSRGQSAAQSDRQAFIFNKAEVTRLGIIFVQGTKILWKGKTYEVVFDKLGVDVVNEPFSYDTVIYCREF